MSDITISVNGLKGFTAQEKAKFLRATDLLGKVLASPNFRMRFMYLRLTSTHGMGHELILEGLLSGKTKLLAEADRDWDVHLEMFFSYKNTVGYTRPSTIWTWINRRYFKKYGPEDIAKNVAHEYAHKCGFDHRSAKETTSVPYALGYLVRDCVYELRVYGEVMPLAAAKSAPHRKAKYVPAA